MRKLLLGAALAFTPIAPGAAVAQGGHVDVSYGTYAVDIGIDFDIDVTQIGGQVAFGSGPVGVQMDGRYADWGGDSDLEAWGLGAHLFTRSDRWLFGGYAGYDNLEDTPFETWTVALETQFYMPRSTISGVLSHSNADDAGFNVTMMEGEYRHFVSDYFSLHGGLGVGQGEFGSGEPDLWSGEVGGEYLFTGAPISVFGFYRRVNLDFGPADFDSDTWSLGVRYNWSGTLMERNRQGAGLNRVLPVFDRWICC